MEKRIENEVSTIIEVSQWKLSREQVSKEDVSEQIILNP
jgi:hypothetical protein